MFLVAATAGIAATTAARVRRAIFIASPLDPLRDGVRNRLVVGGEAHGRHDVLRGVLRDLFDRGERAVADLSDAFFRFRRFRGDLGVGLGRRGIEIGLNGGLRLTYDALRFGAGVRERLVVGVLGLPRLEFQLFGRGDVVRDRARP